MLQDTLLRVEILNLHVCSTQKNDFPRYVTEQVAVNSLEARVGSLSYDQTRHCHGHPEVPAAPFVQVPILRWQGYLLKLVRIQALEYPVNFRVMRKDMGLPGLQILPTSLACPREPLALSYG